MNTVQYLYTGYPNCWGGEWKKWAISRNVICIFKVEFPKPGALSRCLLQDHFKRLCEVAVGAKDAPLLGCVCGNLILKFKTV